MKSLDEYTTKVKHCIDEIREDVNKLNFKNMTRDYIDVMITIVINDKCALYKLKSANIKMIYFARYEPEKIKRKKFNHW